MERHGNMAARGQDLVWEPDLCPERVLRNRGKGLAGQTTRTSTRISLA